MLLEKRNFMLINLLITIFGRDLCIVKDNFSLDKVPCLSINQYIVQFLLKITYILGKQVCTWCSLVGFIDYMPFMDSQNAAVEKDSQQISLFNLELERVRSRKTKRFLPRIYSWRQSQGSILGLTVTPILFLLH